MIGAIFGDIVGSIYEFDNIKTVDFELISPQMTYTDDSILTIAVADWLISNKLNKEQLINIIKDYVNRYPHPMGGYGGRFNIWAKGNDVEPYNSWGNGSAMRVAAVGWAFNTLKKTEEIAKITAEITHNHPEGIKGAQAVAAAIFMARTNHTKQSIRQYITERYGYDLNRTCDEIRPNYTFNESCQATVPEAIIAFLDSDSFEMAIRLAVSLGGDSDTLTSITGAIAEAFYAIDNVVEVHNKVEAVAIKDVVFEKLSEDLVNVVKKFRQKFICNYFRTIRYRLTNLFVNII